MAAKTTYNKETKKYEIIHTQKNIKGEGKTILEALKQFFIKLNTKK